MWPALEQRTPELFGDGEQIVVVGNNVVFGEQIELLRIARIGDASA